MRLLFFSAADQILFERDDADSATWSVDQLSLQATFPFIAGKEILRGMRAGFEWDGSWQVFEIRKVRNYEPGHYQEITAEHIAVSELTDEFFNGDDVTDVTAQAALFPMLTGTLWEIGTVTASNTSSVDVGAGDVWKHIRDIEQNFNVLITPRVTVGAAGITGRYLDIAPNEGIWRGVRLSLEKNADEVGVTWDDSNVKTALYGFGKAEDGVPLTFAEAVWEATADHPAKPDGQTYVVDPDALAAYGRNGRNRFGYYQNASISDPEILLQKTWETLQTVNAPQVTINALVRDLYRFGYADEPIRLHDKVIVELRPMGKTLVKDVIKLDIDLLNPTATRPTIGAYIPNIVYINREAMQKATGGGGLGDDDKTVELKELNTQIISNGAAIRLEAYQRAYEDGQLSESLLNAWASINLDATKITSLVTGTGAQLNQDGTLVTDPLTGDPVFVTTGGGLYSKINQNAQAITLKVSRGDVSTELAVECGNVTISGGNLVVDGMITAQDLQTNTITMHGLIVDNGGCNLGSSNVYLNSTSMLLGVHSLSLTQSGNNYTLAWSDFGGGSHSETFSRATAPTIGGSWSSGVYTVSSDITPASGSVTSTTLYDLGLGSSWAISGTDLTNTFDIGYASVVGGQQVRGGSTGKTGTITVPVPLQTKSFNTNGTKTPDSGYIGFSSVSFTASYSVSSITNNGTNHPSSDYTRLATVSPLGSLTRYYTFSITAAGVQHKYYIQADA